MFLQTLHCTLCLSHDSMNLDLHTSDFIRKAQFEKVYRKHGVTISKSQQKHKMVKHDEDSTSYSVHALINTCIKLTIVWST